MAITVNRNPVTVDPGNGSYKDVGQYFNQTQFKGLCSNQNVDAIDPSTFADVENLYVDSDDTLASRPKLKQHDNFGFDDIEKMWIWDDIHLIYGEKTVDNNSIVLLSDVINEVSLTLTDETLKQVVRIENRIFVFLEDDVYIYEKVENNYTFTKVTSLNVKDYFYIPSDKIIIDGIEQDGQSKNELTGLRKTVVESNNALSFDSNIPNNSTVQFTIDGQDYTITWKTGESYLTLATPYITQYFDILKFAENTDGNKTTVIGYKQDYLYYSFDGTVWERLPYLNLTTDGFLMTYFGISKNGNSVWGVSERSSTPGLYIISIVADQYDGQGNVSKKYPTWTLLHGDPDMLFESYNSSFFPSVDMNDWDDWVFTYTRDVANNDREYVVAVGNNNTVLTNVSRLWGGSNPIETPLQDAKVYTTSLSLGSVSKIYLLFFQAPDCTVFLTPFYINSGNLVPLTGNNSSLFYTNTQGRTLGILFGPLEDMPIVTTYNEDYSHIYVNWIGKYKTFNTVIIPEGEMIDFTYCQADLAWDGNTSKINIIYTNQHLTTEVGYYPFQQVFLTQTNGVKFIGRDSTTWLSKKGLLYIGNTTTWEGNTLRRCRIATPSFPIYSKVDFSKQYDFTDPWGSYTYINFCADTSVLAFSNAFTAFYVSAENVYANPFKSALTLNVLKNGDLWTGLYPQHDVETDNTQYWSFDETLYIESRRYTEDFKPLLYFPEINTEIRPRKITNLLVIDRGVVALFNEYEVWYVTKVTLENSQIAYGYYKSRIGLGCKEGADIDILYDGATITYGTPRGIVGMNYQQLTQNTDQILNFLSDNISTNYFSWYGNGKIKIFKYKFWVVFYKQNSYKCLVLDLRNGSWWYWDSKVEGGLKTIYLYEDKPLLLDVNGQLMSLDDSNTGIYEDLDRKIIDWKATSQPLSFGAINNYKRINSINISNVQLTKDPFNYILICRNYKNQKNVYSPKVVNFEQEKITVGSYRTFVKRLNYIQSVKFQYTIANNSDLPVQTPVSITAISTKYEIKGRVR